CNSRPLDSALTERRYSCSRLNQWQSCRDILPGGVAERLIAPVLKTGRPKGLVSSNLTPSASLRLERSSKGRLPRRSEMTTGLFSEIPSSRSKTTAWQAISIFDFRLAIFDWSQKKMRDQQRAKNPQD